MSQQRKKEEFIIDKYDTKDFQGKPIKIQANVEDDIPKKVGFLQRKYNRIMGAAGQGKSIFFTGFKFGFMVGGTFGLVIGTITGVMNRSFMIIPLSTVASALSFGFFLGIGSIFRSEMSEIQDLEQDKLIEFIFVDDELKVVKSDMYEKYAI